MFGNVVEGFERHRVDCFDLQCLHKALSLGIIVRIASAPHGADQAVRFQHFAIGCVAYWADSNGRRNTCTQEVAMGIRKRRSNRSGRAPLPSPGRPPVAGRFELQQFWLGIAQGMTSEDAALAAGMSQPVGTRLFRKAGGMPPAMFRSSAKPPSGRYSRLRNARRSHFFAFRAFRGARSDADLADPPRPSLVSYDAMPRHAAAAWSIVHRQPNGTPSDRPVGPNRPSLRSTQPCALM